jgi:TetR/AcrR family transcriptional regulator, fatty acid metabolism regulator protein
MTIADAPRSLKDRQRAERERLILDAAEELLAEKGYHEMSIDEIAARVGVSKGTVYLHFSSKEELVLAQLERGMRRFVEAADVILGSAASPSEKLRSLIVLIYRTALKERSQFFTSVYEHPDLRTRLMERKRECQEQWAALTWRISKVFDDGKTLGEFDNTIPTPVLVGLFWSLASPQTYRRLIEQEQMPVDEVVSHLSRFFFKGLAADGSQERNRE